MKEGMKPSFSIPKNDLKKSLCNEAHSHNRGSALDYISKAWICGILKLGFICLPCSFEPESVTS